MPVITAKAGQPLIKFLVEFSYLAAGGWRYHSMEVEAVDSTRAEQHVREQMSGYSVLQVKNITRVEAAKAGVPITATTKASTVIGKTPVPPTPVPAPASKAFEPNKTYKVEPPKRTL